MKYQASCHCGDVKLQIKTDLKIIKQCNCSICKRKNAKMNILPKDAIISISGEENLSTYQFGTNIAKHYFCKNCGIYTHHQRKSDPNGIGVNIGCIDDIDSFQYAADVLDMKSQ